MEERAIKDVKAHKVRTQHQMKIFGSTRKIIKTGPKRLSCLNVH